MTIKNMDEKAAIKPKVNLRDLISTINIVNLHTLPPREFICRRFQIVKGNLNNIIGTGWTGKSFLLQYFAICIATGTKIFGSFEVVKGKVLHIDLEQSPQQTQVRYARMAKALNIKDYQNNIDRIELPSKLDGGSSSLEELTEIFIDLFSGYTVVCIDSLAKLSAADENSTDIGNILNCLKKAAVATRCAVILIHHKGKTKSEAIQTGRGSSVIYDTCDVQIDLEHQKGDDKPFKLSCQKNRDGRSFYDVDYSMEDAGEFCSGQDCYDELSFSLLRDDQFQNKEILFKLKCLLALENGNLTQTTFYKEIKGNRDDFNRAIKVFVNEGYICETPKGQSLVYSITDAGRTFIDYNKEQNNETI
jgi:predicted transcriptional regulator